MWRQQMRSLLVLALAMTVSGAMDLFGHEATTAAPLTTQTETVESTQDTRINGGVMVTQVVPYQVSLQMQRRGKWQHFCGGAIISASHVLTAAHCLQNTNVTQLNVVSDTLTWQWGGVRHRVEDMRMHPQYAMKPKIVNDIAIVKVTPPFDLKRRNVAAVSLGGPGRIGERVAVRLTGWGATTPTVVNGLPVQLQMLDYNTITNEECTRKGFSVTHNEICAYTSKGKGACMGDSGGPLVTTQGIPQLVGIVSYGTAKCAQGRPDVYTRVSSFLPYINKVITTEIP